MSNVSGFYHKLNINILMVEYRGYGLSEGAPNERGLYIDAQSAIDYIMQRTDLDHTKIIVFGRSLGTFQYYNIFCLAECLVYHHHKINSLGYSFS